MDNKRKDQTNDGELILKKPTITHFSSRLFWVKVLAADYELMLRFLVSMRSGGMSNASLKNRLLANQNDRLAWEVNGLKPYPWTLYLKPLRKVGQYIFNKC
ncbi:MAG: hypothetical protein KKH45_04485 [Proteobacteria bacterium]|nr:hypothetical protein [Pseudomonadota bacterium]